MSVVLSRPSPADAAEFIAAVRASAAHLDPWIVAPDTAEWFAAYLARADREDQASYLIRHCVCGGLVGYANINNIVRGALQSGHLGYAGFASHAGRGLMAAGLTAVISDAFASLGTAPPGSQHPARQFALARHRAAARVQARGLLAGVTCSSTASGATTERWAVLAEDWAPAAG